MLGRFSPSLLAFLERRLETTTISSYVLLASVLIGGVALIAPPVIYPRLLESTLQILKHSSQPLSALVDGRLWSVSAKDETEK